MIEEEQLRVVNCPDGHFNVWGTRWPPSATRFIYSTHKSSNKLLVENNAE